jgi:sec-independent protein translocase protein TatB
MFDMSWGEVMVIGAVALIVIGPKDLPKALRTLGQMTTKIRRMAAEFQGQFNEAMREAELDEVKRQIQGVNESVGSLNQGFNPMQTIRDELKGAIDAPATARESTPQGRGEADDPPAPAEPVITLPVPSVPPVVDPAESIRAALDETAEADGTTAPDAAGKTGEKT